MNAIEDASANIERWIENIPPNSIDEHTNLRTIPLFLFPLSAGSGNTIDDGFQPSDTLRVEDTECDKAFRIAGDSMMPQYSDGQIVLVKSIEIVPDGKVGVFFYDGAVYIKQKVIENGKTLLHSFNPEYEDIVLKEEMTYKEYGLVVATYN